MKAKRSEHITKTDCCRRFAWTRYEFDRNAAAGMPVVEAAGHKGGEWRLDPVAVGEWIAQQDAQEAARRRRLQGYLEERALGAKRAEEAHRQQLRDQDQAKREAEKRKEEGWRREEEKRRMDRWLDRAYGFCKRLAYQDIGRPFGPRWPQETPHWLQDWPMERPTWWAPPPGLLEAVMAEPEMRPCGYQEPDWRRWVPRYVPSRPWPWRGE